MATEGSIPSDDASATSNPFAAGWQEVLSSGWCVPIPCVLGTKSAAIAGSHGKDATEITHAWVAAVLAKGVPYSLAGRLLPGYIAIDIDDYVKGDKVKTGWQTFVSVVAGGSVMRAEQLWSKSIRVTSRGLDGRSGSLIFRVPADLLAVLAGRLGPAVDIRKAGLSYIVLAGANPDSDGSSYQIGRGSVPLDHFPVSSEIPDLPEWACENIKAGRKAAAGGGEVAKTYPSAAPGTAAGGRDWLVAQDKDEVPCGYMRAAVDDWDEQLAAAESRYPVMVDATWRAVEVHWAGHRGVAIALGRLYQTYADRVSGEGERPWREEFCKAVDGVVKKLEAVGPRGDECSCGGGPMSEEDWEGLDTLAEVLGSDPVSTGGGSGSAEDAPVPPGPVVSSPMSVSQDQSVAVSTGPAPAPAGEPVPFLLEDLPAAVAPLTRREKDIARAAERLRIAAEARALVEAEDIARGALDPPAPLEWAGFLSRKREAPDWHAGSVFAQGQHIAVVGNGKVGKSLFCMDMAWRTAAGLPFLDDVARPARRVMYVDQENSEQEVQGIFRAFGATEESLAGLIYLSFPAFRPLNTEAGAADLLAMVERYQPDVVYLDTISRMVSGEENSSDTWLALYRLALMPLKARGVSTVRLDHFGKDPEKGARGSLAKTQDVDAVWELTGEADGKLMLKRTHTRQGVGQAMFKINRTGVLDMTGWRDGFTSHVLTNTTEIKNAMISKVVNQLDALGIPNDAGRPALIAACKQHEIPANSVILAEVAKVRKAR